MKYPMTLILGILLILGGVLALSYHTFTYPKEEKIMQIGEMHITADTNKTVDIPPYLGAFALVAGIVLVVVGRKK